VSTYIEYVHCRPEYEEIIGQLAEANNFTLRDLEANRNGKVGQEQFTHHMKDAIMAPVLLLIAGIAVSFVTRVAFAAYVEKESIFHFVGTLIWHLFMLNFDKFRDVYLSTAGHHLPMIVGAFVVTAPATAYKKLRRIPFRIIGGLLRGSVKAVEGPIYASTEQKPAPGKAGKQGDKVDFYYYVHKDLRMPVTGKAHEALPAGMRFRAYYLPYSKTLMSIEPLMD
jgi:hypothetical protein